MCVCVREREIDSVCEQGRGGLKKETLKKSTKPKGSLNVQK